MSAAACAKKNQNCLVEGLIAMFHATMRAFHSFRDDPTVEVSDARFDQMRNVETKLEKALDKAILDAREINHAIASEQDPEVVA